MCTGITVWKSNFGFPLMISSGFVWDANRMAAELLPLRALDLKDAKKFGIFCKNQKIPNVLAENRNFDRNSLRGVQHQFRGGAVILGNAPPLLSIVRCQNHLPQLHPNAR